MDLRYQLAVVAGAGAGVGRAAAVALSRRGAAVLVADRDRQAAEETARLVRAARVAAWVVQGDPAEETERRLLTQRAADLGGADLLVDAGGGGRALLDLFLAGLPDRRGRPDVRPAAVTIGTAQPGPDEAAAAHSARLMHVLPGSPMPTDDELARAVVALLADGEHGDAVVVRGRGR